MHDHIGASLFTWTPLISIDSALIIRGALRFTSRSKVAAPLPCSRPRGRGSSWAAGGPWLPQKRSPWPPWPELTPGEHGWPGGGEVGRAGCRGLLGHACSHRVLSARAADVSPTGTTYKHLTTIHHPSPLFVQAHQRDRGRFQLARRHAGRHGGHREGVRSLGRPRRLPGESWRLLWAGEGV